MTIIEVLELIKQKIEAYQPVPKEFLKGGTEFEHFVEMVVNDLEGEIKDSATISSILISGRNFPDMELMLNGVKYGIEIKSSSVGKWDVPGNSVFESFSQQDYEEIYLLFGSRQRNGTNFEVKYLPYWQATTTIAVTHSPRFIINMESTETIFKTATDYRLLKAKTNEEKVTFLQDYLRNTTRGTKWFTPPPAEAVKPINLNRLSDQIKSQIVSESLILFPQDLLKASGNDYTNTAEHLLISYFYYSHSLRDFFSAGGQWEVNGVKFPQSIKRLYEHRATILSLLDNANSDFQSFAQKSWHSSNFDLDRLSFKDYYCKILDEIGKVQFANLLKTAQIDKLSDFLTNYTMPK